MQHLTVKVKVYSSSRAGIKPTHGITAKTCFSSTNIGEDYVQLRHVETRYRSLFNLVETPVLVCKAESTEILEINPAAIRLLNCDTNAVTGKKLDLFFGEDEKQKVNNFLRKTQLGKETYLKLSSQMVKPSV